MCDKKNQTGSILLFVMVLLAVFSIIAFVMSSLVFRNITLSRTYKDYLKTAYATETGSERALDILSVGRSNYYGLATTIATIEGLAPPDAPYIMPVSGAEYIIDPDLTDTSLDEITAVVSDFPGIQIELYDPDSAFTLMNAESVRFLWNNPECTMNSRIEVTYEKFVGPTFGIRDDSVRKDIYACGVETPVSSEYDCQATSNTLAANTNYIIRVKGLDCTIYGMNIQFYDDNDAGGNVVPVPSQAAIGVQGRGVETAFQI